MILHNFGWSSCSRQQQHRRSGPARADRWQEGEQNHSFPFFRYLMWNTILRAAFFVPPAAPHLDHHQASLQLQLTSAERVPQGLVCEVKS